LKQLPRKGAEAWPARCGGDLRSPRKPAGPVVRQLRSSAESPAAAPNKTAKKELRAKLPNAAGINIFETKAMTQKERFSAVLNWFRRQMPEAETELNYQSPFELLVAVVLSAQCTDKRVNQVTPALFKEFPDAESMAKATSEELFHWIRSVSYPNNKSNHLLGLSKMIVEEFGGGIPSTVSELMRLPGVGRKTANVLVSVLHQQPAMAVDTHVYRVSRRLGLVPQTANTPLKVEQVLMKYIPSHDVHRAHHWLILHGRYICKARNPNCSACGLQLNCRYFSKNPLLKTEL
jgi:endonuclease-3